MGHIQILEAHVINQIAAGEVVERPASVVKELVENAIDAGARRVEVRVREGGRDLIEVSDDGSGIERDDLERVFLPHATSKILGIDDLRHVGTLGFRGEALASIGSVARASIVSRVRGAEEGFRVENREGDISEVAPAAASPGTVVRVEHLFAHVPARRKFLRTAGTEVGHIKTLVGRIALAHPEIAFRLVHGSQTLLETPPDQDRRSRIASVYGPGIAEALIEARSPDAGAVGPTLEAWAGPPSLSRRDGRLEQVFLNGRSIRDKTVAHALREAYRDLLPPGGQRPVAFLFLSCDPGEVDVNVHPGKTEVRWQDASLVHRVVRRTLRARLEAVQPGFAVPASFGVASAPLGSSGEAYSAGTSPPCLSVEETFRQDALEQGGGTARHASSAFAFPVGGGMEVREGADSSGPSSAPPPSRPEGLIPLGQALGTYLLLESEDGLVIVDQHALHERVLFDQINGRLRQSGNLEVQRLLVPLVVHLDAASAARLTEQSELLQSLGWVVEPFGEDAVAVNGVPAVLRRPDPEAALQEMLEVLEQGRREGMDRTTLLSAAVDSLACRSAVMAGDTLHPDEVLALLAQAEALNHSHSCPHGRPTRLRITRGQLEKWFHRTV